MKPNRRGFVAMTVLWPVLRGLYLWLGAASARQDPRHRLPSCPSDSTTYLRGDKARRDQYPDNEFRHDITIDGGTVITGSFNSTMAAQGKNADSLPVIRCQALAARYTRNRDTRRRQGQPYIGRGVRE